MSAGPRDRGVVLMDGGYVENISDVAEAEHGAAVDIEGLSIALSTEFGLDHVRTKFYHAYPYQDESPTAKQRDFYAKRKSFYDSINRKDNHEFVDRGEVKRSIGHCRSCGNSWREYSQKGVDVGIAVDLVDMAYSGRVDALVLVSGDGDLVHAIEAAKNAYVNVFVACCDADGHNIGFADSVTTEADRYVEIDTEYLKRCLEEP